MITETPITMHQEQMPILKRGLKFATRRPLLMQDQYLIKAETSNGLIKGKHCTLPATKSPYGEVGDKIWVQEDWAIDGSLPIHEYEKIDSEGNKYLDPSFKLTYKADVSPELHHLHKWRLPKTMPRWASRFTFMITSLHLQRLNDMVYKDYALEGYFGEIENPQKAYKDFWNMIYGQRFIGWHTNPIVWAIEFKETK